MMLHFTCEKYIQPPAQTQIRVIQLTDGDKFDAKFIAISAGFPTARQKWGRIGTNSMHKIALFAPPIRIGVEHRGVPHRVITIGADR